MTTVTVFNHPGAPALTLKLNNQEQDSVSDRIRTVVETIQNRAREAVAEDPEKEVSVRQGFRYDKVKMSAILAKTNVKIESVNNFATAAGLASSASGLACLARCLAAVYGLEESFEGEFSMFARMGSGSACRSVYGGVVEWD